MADPPFALGADTPPWFFVMDTDALIEAIDLSEVERVDGWVDVNATTNAGFVGAFEARLGGALSIVVDGDGDGMLSEEEWSGGAVAAGKMP